MIEVELKLSEPPLNIVALLDFKHNAAASAATLGRDSKITPITPKGTETFSMFKPLGLFHFNNIFPTGSSNLAIFLIPSQIALIL